MEGRGLLWTIVVLLALNLMVACDSNDGLGRLHRAIERECG